MMKLPCRPLHAVLLAALALPACHGSHGGGTVPGDAEDHTPFSAIAADETIRLVGTEPFWGGDVTGAVLTYTTPENQTGVRVPVTRFAGRGGLSYSGTLDGAALTLAVTPGTCSDGMSDRTYPYEVTVQIGEDMRSGCGWTERQPWTATP